MSESQLDTQTEGNTAITRTPLLQTFTKDVNDYLNHYVMLADAKAGACLAANIAVGVTIAQVSYSGALSRVLLSLSLLACALSGIACGLAVFPRLPRGDAGLIFWEDIRSFATPIEYHLELYALTDNDIVSAYAEQNYLVSDVLHRKHRWLQRGIVLFGVGVVLSLLTYLLFEIS